MKRLLVTLAVVALAVPAFGAWTGDVPDAINPHTSTALAANEYVLASDPTVQTDFLTAWNAGGLYDVVYCGPGLVDMSAASTLNSGALAVGIVGSGSDTDAASNTIFDGGALPDGTGLNHFLSVRQGGADAANPLVFKDFRVQNIGTRVFKIEGGSTGDQSNVTWDNVAISNYAVAADGESGWGDGIELGTNGNGVVQNINVVNSLFDNAGGFGMRLAEYSQDNKAIDWTIKGNEFRNLKAGVVVNDGYTERMSIVDNLFEDMTQYTGEDVWNSYGNAGIILAVRSNGTPTGLGVIKDIVIQGNTIRDAGYVPTGADPVPHPWDGMDILSEAGVHIITCSESPVENVMIRDNVFENTGAAPMKYGVKLTMSDAYRNNQADPGTTLTGNPGEINDVSIDGNTYTNLTTDVYGNQIGTGGWAFPEVWAVDATGVGSVSGVTLGGDENGDNMIDASDINAASGTDRDDLILKALKTAKADFNLDGKVDGVDFLAWQVGYKVPNIAASFAEGDANGDGVNDGVDFLAWQTNYPTLTNFFYPAGAAVPEPATMALLSLGGLALIRRRK